MTFLDWFKSDGDKLFNFISLAAAVLPGVAGIDPKITGAALLVGVLATAAHQSFFPNAPQEKLK